MATKEQKDANRKNAKKSTGPKTTEGKAKASKNAIKHGLTACYNVIEIEDREEFDFFRKEMLDDLYPIGPMQYRLAERIVSLSWRLRRAEIMHDKTIDDLLQKDRDWLYNDMDVYRIHPDLPGDELALGHMAQSDFSGNRVLGRLIMYERRIEYSMYKSMKELKNLKKEKTQNEPNSTNAGNKLKDPPKAAQLNNQSSIINNQLKEPRYKPREVPEDNYEKLPLPMSLEAEEFISKIRKNLGLDEIQDSTIENKESSTENPVSSTEKMQNEPNSKTNAEPKAKSRLVGKPNYNPPCHCEGANTYLPKGSDAAISTTPLNLTSPNGPRPSSRPTPNGSRDTGHESRINMQNEPNSQDQANISTAISEEYEHALLHGYPPDKPYPPQKPINHPRPQAESTNNQSSLINNQLKGSISSRNQGRSEAAHYPRRPLKNRIV